MEEADNAITYETIFEILRRERSSDALNKLDEPFYSNVVRYIEEKNAVGEQDILFNVKRMIKEIYERRERKIVGLAVDKCRLGSDGLNTANMLAEERALYEEVVGLLLNSRRSVMDLLIAGKHPMFVKAAATGQVLAVMNEPSGISSAGQDSGFKEADSLLAGSSSQEGTSLVRFVHAVPKFVGKELEVYGPFEPEEIANLPSEIARLLVTKGRAEEIKGG